MNRADRPNLQHSSERLKKLAGRWNFQIAKSARSHWKPIAIVLFLIATIIPSLAYAKPLNFGVSLSTGEVWSGYCCGSLVYRTSFYGWDKSKALASLLIVTNSSWVGPNEIYLTLWHQPKLDRVALQFQSSSASLGEVTWKDGGSVPLWNSTMGERPSVSTSQDPRIGVLSFQKLSYPEYGFSILLEFSSQDEVILTVEIGLSGDWMFGVQHYQGSASLPVRPNQIGQTV